MAVRRQISRVFGFWLVTAVACAPAAAGTVPPLETIVARMAQARAQNRARIRAYTVTRDYKLFDKDQSRAKSEVIADLTFVPPDVKQYAIRKSNGAGMGEKLVRRMLAAEAEVAKDFRSTDLSPPNYAFRLLGSEEMAGQRCYVLELIPLRKDKNLLRGKIWVDADTYLPHRIEGEPAKNPSWWLHNVHVSFRYRNVGGNMWLPTGSEASAYVRIIGRYTMVTRDLNYKVSEQADGEKATATASEREALPAAVRLRRR